MRTWLKATLLLLSVGYIAAIAIEAQPKVTLKKFTTSQERIRSHGYAAESHFVETRDGYVLNIFRLPYSHKLQNQNKPRPAILLQHGLLSNSDSYLGSGPDHSLAYNLVDAGYDVWLGNARGNIYSRKNNKISINHPNFWHFSWHEIGTIDIAAMIDYIIKQTGQKKIHYAGHSQGTTVYFALMSTRPEYNAKVKSAHMLAPCAFMSHGTSFIYKLLSPLVGKPGGIWNSALEDMEILPQNELFNRLADNTCGANTPTSVYCKNMYLWFTADGYDNTNMTALQVLLETHPAGISSNQGIHYIQLFVSQQFRQYDFGAKKNQQLYGQSTPPNYDLSKITAPTYLYSSQNDALCVPEDVDILVSKMPKLACDYRIPDPTWNHVDFIAARDIKTVINERVIKNCNAEESKL